MNNRVRESLSDDGSIEDFVNDFLSVLNASGLEMSLSDNRDVLLLNKGGVLLVDDGLMMFMNVLFIHNRLVMLMNDVLMMLSDNISLVLHNDVFVVLMNDILMDFFHKRSEGMRLSNISLINSHNLLTFVKGLDHSSLVVLNNNWLFVDSLNVSLSSHDLLVLVDVTDLLVLVNVTNVLLIRVNVAKALSLNKVGLLESLSEGLVEATGVSVRRSLHETSGRALNESGGALNHPGGALEVAWGAMDVGVSESGGAMHVLTTDNFFGNSHILLNDGGTTGVLESAGSALITAELIGSEQVGVLFVTLSVKEGLSLILNELSHCIWLFVLGCFV